MYPYIFPFIKATDYDKENKPPEQRMDDLERDRKGAEIDTFDEESAGYMDRQGIITAQHRTEFGPDDLGCGSKFSSEANKPKNGRC